MRLFWGFEKLKSTTRAGIAEKILASLENYGISEGAWTGLRQIAAMKGDLNGAQAIIQKKYRKALYVHCSSHTLNLVVCHAASVREISNCIGTIK